MNQKKDSKNDRQFSMSDKKNALQKLAEQLNQIDFKEMRPTSILKFLKGKGKKN